MAKHAVLSASGSSRWIACPGSIRMSKGITRTTSKYAEEGIAAHELAEHCIGVGVDALDFIGDTFNKYPVTEEMAEAVQVYLDWIREEEYIEQGLEEKFDLSWFYPGMFGTNDCWLYSKKQKKLTVVDYKHGRGVAVDVEWNKQMLYYALGAARKLIMENKEIKTVNLVVVQPRAYHDAGTVREWFLTVEELNHWAVSVLRPAAIATEDNDAPLHVGKHCRWCPAMAICPEQINKNMALAKTKFQEMVLPAPQDMQGEDFAKIIEASTRLEAWKNECVIYAQGQAERGVKIPGLKLVAKKSNRRWVDTASAEDKIVDLLGEDAYEQKLITLSKVEKALGKKVFAEKFSEMVEKPDNGLTLVLESDKRKEAAPPVEAAFKPIDVNVID